MPGDISSRHIMNEDDIIKITNIDRFRPSLKCDLFIPSYVHSLSIATEFIYNYVLKRFPPDYFATIHIGGKHPFDDFRRFNKGDLIYRNNPALAINYTLQYDYNDNDIDYNLLSTNKYLKRSVWQRSFFKCPSKNLYIGMDLEAMLINYTFRFRENLKAQQLDLFNRLRKVFRLGCTETLDIDCDFHLNKTMIAYIAKEAGFAVDPSTNEVLDPWNFIRFLNSYSQMPILYKLRFINQKYEYFLRMRNLPVHLSFTNGLDVDDGNQSGMTAIGFTIEFPIEVRFPAPRTFALYNEGKWIHQINVENNEGINIISVKVADIPEENYKGWPMYGHSNYMAEKNEKIVESIDIGPLFTAPVDVKIGTDLNSIIQDSLNQFISPDSFIEIAVYINDFTVDGSGRLPIKMDWKNRKIILPPETTAQYYYIAIYIDREYINSKVIEFTNADKNRIIESRQTSNESNIRKGYDESHYIEETKFQNTNLPKSVKRKHARFIVNK